MGLGSDNYVRLGLGWIEGGTKTEVGLGKGLSWVGEGSNQSAKATKSRQTPRIPAQSKQSFQPKTTKTAQKSSTIVVHQHTFGEFAGTPNTGRGTKG